MRISPAAIAAVALLLPAAARAQSPEVRYEITSRAELRATPAAKAKVVTQIDSGTVILLEGAEESGPQFTRVTYNGQSGWIDNTMLRRVVTVRDPNPFRIADTVRVTRVDTVVRVDTVRVEAKKSRWAKPR
jgi:hypothetical protein